MQLRQTLECQRQQQQQLRHFLRQFSQKKQTTTMARKATALKMPRVAEAVAERQSGGRTRVHWNAGHFDCPPQSIPLGSHLCSKRVILQHTHFHTHTHHTPTHTHTQAIGNRSKRTQKCSRGRHKN